MPEPHRDHELPAGVGLARGDVHEDPAASAARGAALMASSATAIIDGVRTHAAAYALRRATEILDAWAGEPAEGRDVTGTKLLDAAAVAAQRVLDELEQLLAADPAEQRYTPLEIVRTLRREPSEVLAAAGVPPIVRDPFEERALPDDPYGLAARSLADLGDTELGPMLLAWGVGKATVLRARAASPRSDPTPRTPVENLSIAGEAAGTARTRLGTINRAARDAIGAFRRRARERANRR